MEKVRQACQTAVWGTPGTQLASLGWGEERG